MPAVKSPGLPNITGSFYIQEFTNDNGPAITEGALYSELRTGVIDCANGTGNQVWALMLDASRSNSIYGNSDTVQSPALVFIPQIKY